jgi:lysophospholipid acyltransferase (LPLAT)-like uncharacterized protein
MDPIVRWAERLGLRVVRGGGKGQDSRAALKALERVLTDGSGGSVVLAVDGPGGPHRRLKRGCVDLARATGAPIVLVSYTLLRGQEDRGRWDRRLVPAWGFETVALRVSREYDVAGRTFAAVAEEIEAEYAQLVGDAGSPETSERTH